RHRDSGSTRGHGPGAQRGRAADHGRRRSWHAHLQGSRDRRDRTADGRIQRARDGRQLRGHDRPQAGSASRRVGDGRPAGALPGIHGHADRRQWSQLHDLQAQFAAQTCTATSAVLGSAGTTTIHRDFAGAPFAGTWYNQALANKYFGSDLSVANPDINATFNLSIDAGCFGPGQVWYYGTDGNEGTNIELLPVVLHEIGHGLGFQTFTSGSTGNYNSGFPSIADRYLYDTVNALHWNQNTAAQRVASAISLDQLA